MHRHPSRRLRRIAYTLAGLYAVGVVAILAWPTTVDDKIPSAKFQSALSWVDSHGMYDDLEFTANIAMFVPAGVILATLLPWPRLVAAAVGMLASAAAEIGQALLLPGRISDPHDVLANTIGTAFGVVGVVLLEQFLADRDAARQMVVAPLLPTQREVHDAADDRQPVRS